jgi:hypothetical protein
MEREIYKEQKKYLHVVFVDLEKAYDKIPRIDMWRVLEKHKVPTKYITLIRDTSRRYVQCTLRLIIRLQL